MNIEIERKFLVKTMPSNSKKTIHIRQYYLSINETIVQRLRIFDNSEAILSFKQNCSGLSRYEFEYKIPLEDANKIIEISNPISIEKNRYLIEYQGLNWEVDQFLGDNKGLVIAVVELEEEKQNIVMPDWVDIEITNEKKYYNYNLALNPYISWKG